MRLLFVSDYVCPYCLVAREALQQALAECSLPVQVTWQPFELTPEPRERVDTYHDAERRARYRVLEEPCRWLGLDMKLPPRVVPRPYTRLAFEGWFYACEQGRGEEYSDLVYRAYFTEEQDIGDPTVLKELARRAGLDAEAFAAALANGTYAPQEKAAVDYARNDLQVRGVPSLYLNGEKVAVKEYTKEEMLRILQEGAAADADAGPVCGENGCTMG